MSSGSTRTSSGGRTRAALAAPGARLGLVALHVAGLAAPLAAAVAGAWFVEAHLADHVTGGARLAYITVAAVAVLGAVDSLVTGSTRDLYTRLYSHVHGSRTWSCEDCPASITADRWTPGDAAAYEALISDPVAHRCTGAPQK